MNRKIKLLGVTVMAALMILLAFSGLAHNNGTMDNQSSGHSSGVANMIVGKHNNITTLNTQEMHDLQEFMKYNIIHYGLHSGKLDRLQYKADMNFLTWYIGNFSQIPSAYRGITQQNASVMLPIWENESARAQSDVQAVANYEVNQHASQYHINTAYIVNNRLGNLVSNRTTMYNNESANLLVYKYVKNNQSLVYELIDQKGSFIPVDPYIRLNAFTIHWGWGGLISGTSYNIYFNFTTYNNALNFKNFLDTASTITAWVEFAMDTILWTAVAVLTGGVVGLMAVVYNACSIDMVLRGVLIHLIICNRLYIALSLYAFIFPYWEHDTCILLSDSSVCRRYPVKVAYVPGKEVHICFVLQFIQFA